MCQPESERPSTARRILGRLLSIFVLVLVATTTVTLSVGKVTLSVVKEAAIIQQQDILVKPQKQHNNISSLHTNTVHCNITLNLNKRTNNTSFILANHNVSLCTQIRNEPLEDVIEWLTYYRLVYRVEGVCIIDDASTIEYGDVFHAFDVHTVPSRNDRNQNFDLCRKCLGIHGEANQRIFISDVDEFLYIEQEERFAEYLQLFDQVSMYVINFGNAHSQRNHSESLVLHNIWRAPHYCRKESYNHSLTCQDGCWYDTFKSISRDASVTQYLTHTSKVNGISIPMPCDIATVYHYFVRSQQEFQTKFAWDEDSKWHVHKKYEHVLDNIDYYTSVLDDRLKQLLLKQIPDYPELLHEYKTVLLTNTTV